jgi:hypothetical protein
MEDVAGMEQEIDLAREDVRDRRFERALDVDRALIASGFGIGLAVGVIPEMGVGQMRKP